MKKNKRILIITDSIAIPRPGITYEDTWIYKLRMHCTDYDIIDRPERGSTTFRLVNEGGGGVDLLEYYNPDVVILQMGMAECAPRLFRKSGFEHLMISKILPEKMRNSYIKFVKKHRGREPKNTYISPEQFRLNITKYFERAQKIGTRIIAISILPPNNILLSKSPKAGENIILYNSIYRETAAGFPNVTIVDPIDPDIDVNKYALDEVHLNPAGLDLIYKKLIKFL